MLFTLTIFHLLTLVVGSRVLRRSLLDDDPASKAFLKVLPLHTTYVLEGPTSSIQLCTSQTCATKALQTATTTFAISSNNRVTIENDGIFIMDIGDVDPTCGCECEQSKIQSSMPSSSSRSIHAIFISNTLCNEVTWDGIAQICGRDWITSGTFRNCFAYVRRLPYGVNEGGEVGIPILGHELGHTVGLTHSGSWEATGPNIGQFTVTEYGDVWSTMGNPRVPYPLNFPHRFLLGYFEERQALVRKLEPTGGSTGKVTEVFYVTLGNINAEDISEIGSGNSNAVAAAWWVRDKSYGDTETHYVISYQGAFTNTGFTAPPSISIHFIESKNWVVPSGTLIVDETNEVKLVYRTEEGKCQFPKIYQKCQTKEWKDPHIGDWKVEILGPLTTENIPIKVTYTGDSGGISTSPPSPPYTPPPYPTTTCNHYFGPLYYSDGYCDSTMNNPACNYDGGDCCESACKNGLVYICGKNGYYCKDPVEGFNGATRIGGEKFYGGGWSVAVAVAVGVMFY